MTAALIEPAMRDTQAGREVSIELASVVDWAGFSRAVRHLRAAAVPPEDVRWRFTGEAVDDLFAPRHGAAAAGALPEAPAMRLPRGFVDAAREAFLHADPARLPLLHRLACRIAGDARAWDDPLCPDRLQLDRLRREVAREIHKMHAFVRFRRIEASVGTFVDEAASAVGGPCQTDTGRGVADTTRHVAWFEPGHHVLEAAAPFFARRFAAMRWAILTPRVCVEWDGRALAFGPGARADDLPPADAGEALWLAYYRSIFNPARVKIAMMKKEMPVRFWKNLPEAASIGPLLAEASERQQRMISAGGVERLRRRGRPGAASDPADAETGTSTAIGAASFVAHGHAAERAGACVDANAVSNADALADTQAAAQVDAQATLTLLRRQAARCRDCPVADAATQTVFGEGPADARLMIVGEQPGDQEDLRGRPFQGPAGQLLHAAFDELGWDAGQLWLTNAVKHFHHELRGKRRLHKTPGQREAEACLHWLDAEIAALRPAAIVALGATAARSLLGRDVGVQAHEGQWFARADGTPVLVCLHPAAILRADEARRPALRERWIETLRCAAPFAKAGEAAATDEAPALDAASASPAFADG